MNATANKSKTLLEDYPDVSEFVMLLIHNHLDESKLDDGFDELMDNLKRTYESQKRIIEEYNYQLIMFFSLNVFLTFVYFRKAFKFYDDLHCETTFQNARFVEIDLALYEEINGD